MEIISQKLYYYTHDSISLVWLCHGSNIMAMLPCGGTWNDFFCKMGVHILEWDKSVKMMGLVFVFVSGIGCERGIPEECTIFRKTNY